MTKYLQFLLTYLWFSITIFVMIFIMAIVSISVDQWIGDWPALFVAISIIALPVTWRDFTYRRNWRKDTDE